MQTVKVTSKLLYETSATYGSQPRISHSHIRVVLRFSFQNFSLRIFEQKRDCSQSNKALVMQEIYANILMRTVKHNTCTIWRIRALIVNSLLQVSVNSDITKTNNHCTTYNLFKLNILTIIAGCSVWLWGL